MQVCMCSVEVELPLQEGDLFWRLMPFRRKVSGGSLVLFPCTAHPESSRTWSLLKFVCGSFGQSISEYVRGRKNEQSG